MDLQVEDLRIHADALSIERDSLKDETVVFVFIFATAGLLLWAFVKPYVQKWLVVGTALSRDNRSHSSYSNLFVRRT